MNTSSTKLLALLMLLGMRAPAWAQAIVGLEIDPRSVPVDVPVNVTVLFPQTATVNCGLQINFGDGEIEPFIARRSAFSISKRYKSAGTYGITVEGKSTRIGFDVALYCAGSSYTKLVTIVSAAPPSDTPTPNHSEPANKPSLEPPPAPEKPKPAPPPPLPTLPKRRLPDFM